MMSESMVLERFGPGAAADAPRSAASRTSFRALAERAAGAFGSLGWWAKGEVFPASIGATDAELARLNRAGDVGEAIRRAGDDILRRGGRL